jgi:hypothetical protein
VVFLHARGGKRCHVDHPVGDQMTDFIVMDNGDDGNTRALLFVDQIDHDRAIGGIEGRATRLIPSSYAPRKAVAAA